MTTHKSAIKIRPLGDRILVKRMEEAGKVQRMEVKVGDRILMSKYSGSEVKIDGQEYVILREEDVLGIIEL
jgi:chaperonin GroES